LGYQLLADPAFPRDQDRMRAPRQALDGLEQFEHQGTPGDNAGEGRIARGVGGASPEGLDLLPQSEDRSDVADDRDQPRRRYRLGDVVEGAPLHAFDYRGGTLVAGYDCDEGLPALRYDSAQHIRAQSVAEIEEDRIEAAVR
jgi:hypothetical protein